MNRILKYLMAGSILTGIQNINAADVTILTEKDKLTIADTQYPNGTNLFLKSPLQISHPIAYDSGMQTGVNILIGNRDDDKDSYLILAPTSSDDYLLSPVRFDTPNSKLILNSADAGGNITFQHYFPGIGGFLYDEGNGGNFFSGNNKVDQAGILELIAAGGNELTLKVQNGTTGPIGVNSTNRIQSIIFAGDSKITIDPPVYAYDIVFANEAPIYLNSGGDGGDNGAIILETNGDLHLGAPLTITNPELQLRNNQLTINGNALNLSGSATLILGFLGNEDKTGSITTANGGSVNSTLTDVNINFYVDLTNEQLMAANPTEYSLRVFEDNVVGAGIPVNITQVDINQNPFQGNAYVDWSFDNATGTIKSKTDWVKLQEDLQKIIDKESPKEVVNIAQSIAVTATNFVNDVKNNVPISPEAEKAGIKATAFVQAIGESAVTPQDLADALNTLKNTLQTIQEDGAIEEVTSTISEKTVGFAAANVTFANPTTFSPQVSVPANSTPNLPGGGVNATTPQAPLSTGNNSGSASVTNPGTLNNPGGSETQSPSTTGSSNQGQNIPNNNDPLQSDQQNEAAATADAYPLGYGIAAGDDLTSKYGIWFSPFYQKAIQKKIGLDSGYKVANMGGTIGIDCKVNESASVGFAWSNIKSIIDQKDAKEGSKAITRSNFFTLYGTYELPKNFFLSAVGSYGISNIKNSDRRKITSTRSQYAKSSYKTQIYSGQLMLGKNIPLKSNFMVSPLAGIKYTKFYDDAYKETGTSFLNYSLTKKKYSYLDGLLGTKISYDTLYNGYRMVPHISAMAHINLKDNPSTSYLTGDAFLNTIQLKGDKRDEKAWYTIGAGIDLSKDNMEYSFSYENQIDKKYIGHMAKVKIKLNF